MIAFIDEHRAIYGIEPIRGKPVKTTVSDKGAACPLDKVNR